MTELGQPITTKVKMQEAIIVSLKVKQEESQREIDLLKRQLDDSTKIALTSSQVDFFLPVFPGERVMVVSEKEVFRFNKLKCKVKLLNEKGELVCRGQISGMIKA